MYTVQGTLLNPTFSSVNVLQITAVRVRSTFFYILSYFPKDELLVNHLKSLKELVDRDKNRPSVVMWSVGNEPKSYR